MYWWGKNIIKYRVDNTKLDIDIIDIIDIQWLFDIKKEQIKCKQGVYGWCGIYTKIMTVLLKIIESISILVKQVKAKRHSHLLHQDFFFFHWCQIRQQIFQHSEQ